jgi:hypothetical protein
MNSGAKAKWYGEDVTKCNLGQIGFEKSERSLVFSSELIMSLSFSLHYFEIMNLLVKPGNIGKTVKIL